MQFQLAQRLHFSIYDNFEFSKCFLKAHCWQTFCRKKHDEQRHDRQQKSQPERRCADHSRIISLTFTKSSLYLHQNGLVSFDCPWFRVWTVLEGRARTFNDNNCTNSQTIAINVPSRHKLILRDFGSLMLTSFSRSSHISRCCLDYGFIVHLQTVVTVCVMKRNEHVFERSFVFNQGFRRRISSQRCGLGGPWAVRCAADREGRLPAR